MAFGEELIIKLGLNSTAMERGLARAEGSVKRWASSIGTRFTGLFAGAAIAGGLKATIDYADKLVDIADGIGTSTTFLQQFTRAAQVNGGSSEQAATSLQFLSRTIGEANSGVEEARKKFAKWGIDLVKTKGTVEGVTNAIQEAARNMTTQNAAAMAMDFFGRGGKDMVATLRLGADEMARFRDGLPTDDDVRVVAALADELVRVAETAKSKVISGVGTFSMWWTNTSMLQKMMAPLGLFHQMMGYDNPFTPEFNATWRGLTDPNRLRLLKELSESQATRAAKGAPEQYGPTVDELKKSAEINKDLKRIEDLKAAAMDRQVAAQKRLNELQSDLATSRRDKASITLAELVNAPFRFRGRLGVEQQMAGRVNWLENAAEWNRSHGYSDLALRQQEMARNIRSQMTNLPSMERYPEKDLQKSIEDANTSLIKVLKDDGIKIKELTEG